MSGMSKTVPLGDLERVEVLMAVLNAFNQATKEGTADRYCVSAASRGRMSAARIRR